MELKDCFVPSGTLCWDCERACGQCSWSERDPETDQIRYEPVPGWTAVPTVLPSNNTFNRDNPRNRSYKVLACPLYIKTPPRESSALELTEEQDRWYRALHGIPTRRDF